MTPLLLSFHISETQQGSAGTSSGFNLFPWQTYKLNSSWNIGAYSQTKKGAGKNADDYKNENRLSHRILNPFWMTMFTAVNSDVAQSICIAIKRQTRLAEHLWEENTDVWKYRCGHKLRWQTVKRN